MKTVASLRCDPIGTTWEGEVALEKACWTNSEEVRKGLLEREPFEQGPGASSHPFTPSRGILGRGSAIELCLQLFSFFFKKPFELSREVLNYFLFLLPCQLPGKFLSFSCRVYRDLARGSRRHRHQCCGPLS